MAKKFAVYLSSSIDKSPILSGTFEEWPDVAAHLEHTHDNVIFVLDASSGRMYSVVRHEQDVGVLLDVTQVS